MSRNWQLLRDICSLSRNWGTFTSGKQKHLRILGDITVPSVDSFRGHLRQKRVKMHIFVLQGKPCISNAHACVFPLNKPKTVMVKVEWVKIMFFFVFFSLSFLLPLSHKRESQFIGKVTLSTLSETYETVCWALPDGSFGRVFHCLFVKSLNLSFNSLLLSLKSRKKSGCHVQDRCLFA